MRRLKVVVTGAVCVAVLGAGVWFWMPGAEADIRLRPNDPEVVAHDEDIVAVLSFIKSTWPGKTQRRHDDINMRTKKPGN